jgi:hypothetical protein
MKYIYGVIGMVTVIKDLTKKRGIHGVLNDKKACIRARKE